MDAPTLSTERSAEPFRHEALLYAGRDEFLEGTVPFIEEGVAAGEPTLVVVGAAKLELLRAALNGAAESVRFADMLEVGDNPARIIPAWRDFVTRHADGGGAVRGIGEPIFPERGHAELVECHRHESLLNFAFAETPGFWLLCPYDTDALGSAVIEEARRNHPYLTTDGVREENAGYSGLEVAAAPFAAALPEPVSTPEELAFALDDLHEVRGFAARRAELAGVAPAKAEDFVLAVNEVASNSVRHAGGRGLLRIWEDDGALLCEVRDEGGISDPLAGRVRPAAGQSGGSGLWMANQLCDLVQVRSLPDGSAVRLHVRRR